jgi:2'-5' RNA ligase
VRLFAGIWPPPAVRDVLAGLARPDHPSIRWTTADQWHVTLRFLGAVDEGDLPALTATLGEVGRRLPPRRAHLGPATVRLGRGTLAVPVGGVDDLGAAVAAATRDVGRPPERRTFAGHLTLARARGQRPVPAALVGSPMAATWTVDEVVLVRSHLDHHGARYETVVAVPLTGP